MPKTRFFRTVSWKLFCLAIALTVGPVGRLWSSDWLVSITVSPQAVTLGAGESKQFTAQVVARALTRSLRGVDPDTRVSWSVNPAVGTISAGGLYTAPTSITTRQVVTVRAVSLLDSTKSATAVITLTAGAPSAPAPAPVSVSVAPSSATLTASQTQQLTVTVTGTTNTGVAWSLNPAVGTLSTSGATAVYTAPSNIVQAQAVEVLATSMADGSKVGKAILKLVPVVAVAVSPATVTLEAGQAQQFTASVTGTTNTAVVWSVNPAVGTVSSSGLYTAPANVTADQEVTITAQSAADASKKGAATVKVKAASSIGFTLGDKGLKSLVWKGKDYNYGYPGEALVLWSGSPWIPPCAKTVTGDSVTHQCATDEQSLRLKVSYSTRQNDTVCADIELTNTSRTPIERAFVNALGIQTGPQTAGWPSGDVQRGNPVSVVMFNEGAAKFAVWQEIWSGHGDAPPKIAVQYNYYALYAKMGMQIFNVAAGETRRARHCVRFTDNVSISAKEWVPEAFEQYAAQYPMLTQWPDRRPIMRWFIADGGKRSLINPRGYFWDPNLDVSNGERFRQVAMNQTNSIINMMNARPVRPQAMIIWDIEGQEFNHATTYLGDPRVFSYGYAPEMNAVVDDIFAAFRNAGYRVGVTLRPQRLLWGTELPATCTYNSNMDLRDQFVKINNPFGQRFHVCNENGNGWYVWGGGSGTQMAYTNTAANIPEVTNLLRSKIEYAKNRWGVTVFYVDSAVWTGGGPISADIFRRLQQEFPDCLFIPEQETMDTMSASIPFADPRVPGDPRLAPLSWRWVYPTGAFAMAIGDCGGTCWTSNVDAFKMGQKIGDIAMYGQPGQMDWKQLQTIETMIQQVREEASLVSVTDTKTGQKREFRGTPASILAYPVKMRVYFAPTAAELERSTVYCEAGQWLGENSCNLNLSGMGVSQIRYYDFTNQFVRAETPIPMK